MLFSKDLGMGGDQAFTSRLVTNFVIIHSQNLAPNNLAN
jgi:hypothetical protein